MLVTASWTKTGKIAKTASSRSAGVKEQHARISAAVPETWGAENEVPRTDVTEPSGWRTVMFSPGAQKSAKLEVVLLLLSCALVAPTSTTALRQAGHAVARAW